MNPVLIFVFLSFFVLGMPDGILGVAWPDMRGEMSLPIEWIGRVIILHSVFYSAASSLLGRIAKKLTLPHINLAGLGLMSAGFAAMALAPAPHFLMASTLLTGTGMGFVDSSLNSYMAKSFSARQMNLMHCFWGLGASSGPMIMTAAILAASWRLGYGLVSALLAAALVLVAVSVLKKVWHGKSAAEESAPARSGPLTRKRYQICAVAIFLLYTGAEYSFGLWTPSVLLESRGLSREMAGLFPTVYYACIMLGRLAVGLAGSRAKTKTVLRGGLAVALCGVILMVFADSIIGAALVGLGFAPVFPCLIDATADRFDEKIVTRLIGFQVAAAGAGVALVSSCIGQLLGRVSLELLFPIIAVLAGLVFVLNEAVAAGAARKFSTNFPQQH